MNQYEAADAIVTVIPESTQEVTAAMKSPFAIVKIFTKYIQKLVEAQNEARIEKCLKVMDRIYERGDSFLKNAIENVFIFSFDSVLLGCDRPKRRLILGIMPMGLYTIYINQIYKSGI